MKLIIWITVAAILGAGWAARAHAEIYACEGEDGVTSYQDQPCPAPKPEPTAADPDIAAEPAEPQTIAPLARPTAPIDPELVAACKKRYRDEIDRLDAEIREGFLPEEREAYREQARALSQRLSRCDYDATNPASGDGRSEPPG